MSQTERKDGGNKKQFISRKRSVEKFVLWFRERGVSFLHMYALEEISQTEREKPL